MLITEGERREYNEALEKKNKIEQAKRRETLAFVLGVDLGQSADYSAFVGVEKVRITEFEKWVENPTARVELNNPYANLEPTYKVDIEYHIKLIDRARLGTSYADIVRHIYKIVNAPSIKDYLALGNLKPIVALDASGIGRAVFDMLQEAGVREVRAITATGGENIHEDGEYYTVPKTHLAALIKGLFGRGILKIAKDLPEADTLIRELENYLIKRTASANVKLEAAGSGHDDLVSALSLACFIAENEETYPLIAPVEIRKDRMSHGMRRSSSRTSSRAQAFSSQWL
jgi:hypothetical protein